jgi:hypothetical protein
MAKKFTPEYLETSGEFELLKEVSHKDLRTFILEQVREEKTIIGIYSVYQVILMMIFIFFLTRGIVLAIKVDSSLLVTTGWSIIFSFTALIVIHELLHALAYFLTGARRISFGVILKKFIFYALADRQVISKGAFHVVALMPLIVVKLVCIWGMAWFWDSQLLYFFLMVMCLHSLFCAGDMAMLAFYRIHKEKEIYNFDDRSEGKTYFYARIKNDTVL